MLYELLTPIKVYSMYLDNYIIEFRIFLSFVYVIYSLSFLMSKTFHLEIVFQRVELIPLDIQKFYFFISGPSV